MHHHMLCMTHDFTLRPALTPLSKRAQTNRLEVQNNNAYRTQVSWGRGCHSTPQAMD